MERKIKVLIADDHMIVRVGLAALLGTEKDMEVIGQAKNGVEAVRETQRLGPDVVIMDLMMPKKNGVEATAEILANTADVKIIILTTFGTSDGIAHALSGGRLRLAHRQKVYGVVVRREPADAGGSSTTKQPFSSFAESGRLDQRQPVSSPFGTRSFCPNAVLKKS